MLQQMNMEPTRDDMYFALATICDSSEGLQACDDMVQAYPCLQRPNYWQILIHVLGNVTEKLVGVQLKVIASKITLFQAQIEKLAIIVAAVHAILAMPKEIGLPSKIIETKTLISLPAGQSIREAMDALSL